MTPNLKPTIILTAGFKSFLAISCVSLLIVIVFNCAVLNYKFAYPETNMDCANYVFFSLYLTFALLGVYSIFEFSRIYVSYRINLKVHEIIGKINVELTDLDDKVKCQISIINSKLLAITDLDDKIKTNHLVSQSDINDLKSEISEINSKLLDNKPKTNIITSQPEQKVNARPTNKQ